MPPPLLPALALLLLLTSPHPTSASTSCPAGLPPLPRSAAFPRAPNKVRHFVPSATGWHPLPITSNRLRHLDRCPVRHAADPNRPVAEPRPLRTFKPRYDASVDGYVWVRDVVQWLKYDLDEVAGEKGLLESVDVRRRKGTEGVAQLDRVAVVRVSPVAGDSLEIWMTFSRALTRQEVDRAVRKTEKRPKYGRTFVKNPKLFFPKRPSRSGAQRFRKARLVIWLKGGSRHR